MKQPRVPVTADRTAGEGVYALTLFLKDFAAETWRECMHLRREVQQIREMMKETK